MADPVSLMAVGALVMAGRNLSTKTKPPEVTTEPLFMKQPKFVDEDNFVPSPRIEHKHEMPNFGVIAPGTRSSGQEMGDMRNRMYDHGRMNNLSPIERELVGPGLGLGPNVPAGGGFHQLMRVNPINVGEYKLTTLPGRTGPAADQSGGRAAVVGQLTHNKPATTAHLPSRLPTVPGRAQGMTGVVPRNEHERTKRTTNRSQTGYRSDGLEFNPGKRVVSSLTNAQDPTRNKSDNHGIQYAYNNQPAPGISNFKGGYTNTAAAQITTKNNEQLMKYGFRPEDKRSKPNRAGNPGRMNVRESALRQGGAVTAVRSDTSRIDGRFGAANGGWMQNYQQKPYHNFNAYKGQVNPHVNNLGLVKKQLENNPLAHRFYQ
jgi:hypothetical protein